MLDREALTKKTNSFLYTTIRSMIAYKEKGGVETEGMHEDFVKGIKLANLVKRSLRSDANLSVIDWRGPIAQLEQTLEKESKYLGPEAKKLALEELREIKAMFREATPKPQPRSAPKPT